MNENVEILLVGNSGDGKSEFILSFLNEGDRRKIPASGECQTTRTCMEYEILCNPQKEHDLRVEILLKDEEVFAQKRVESIEETFEEMQDWKNAAKRSYKQLESELIHDEAFFDCKEFGSETAQAIEDQYAACFDESFFQSLFRAQQQNQAENPWLIHSVRYDAMKEALFPPDASTEEETEGTDRSEADADEQRTVAAIQCFELFARWMYRQCRAQIAARYKIAANRFVLPENAESGEIGSFLKAGNGDDPQCSEVSYSSLVEKVKIRSFIARYYQEMFYGSEHSLGIECIRFVDTYGLDHSECTDSEILCRRYTNLLVHEYPDITTVLYIRKINGGAPSDLEHNIPLLFRVRPDVMSYAVVTRIDRVEAVENSKVIRCLEDDESKIYNKVFKALQKMGVPEDVSQIRIKTMSEHVVRYCSLAGKPDEPKCDKYMESNKEGLRKLFLAIRDKKHLGELYIDLNRLTWESLEDVFSVKKIFRTHEDFRAARYPGRTIGALADRLQRGELGFYSSTLGCFKYWKEEVYNLLKERFNSTIKMDGGQWESVLNQNQQQQQKEILSILQGVLYEFEKNLVEYPRESRNKKEQMYNVYDQLDSAIVKRLYQAKRSVIDQKTIPVSDWLTRVYNFEALMEDPEVANDLQDVVKEAFERCFVAACREHNASLLASELSRDMEEEEIDRRLDAYYAGYDSNLDEEQQDEFAMEVNKKMSR